MRSRQRYKTIIIHQFDPEQASPGGIDTCIRGLVRNAPRDETILIVGTSQSRPLHRAVKLTLEGQDIHFVPVSRLRPGNQRRVVPHSLRMLVGMLFSLVLLDTRDSTFHVHRVEAANFLHIFPSRGIAFFIHTDVTQAVSRRSDSFWKYAPWLYEKLERRAIEASKLCVTFSTRTVQYLAERGIEVWGSTTWFNEEIFFSPKNESRNIDVLWVGRLEEPKDPLLAVDTMHAFTERESIRRCAIVGDGTLRDLVSSATSGSPNVVMLGPKAQPEIGRLLRDSKVLLMTSHFEGSPIVLYEAMASGTPVVATTASDPDGVIDNQSNGFTVDSRDPKELAAFLERAAHLHSLEIAKCVTGARSSIVATRIWEKIEKRVAMQQ